MTAAAILRACLGGLAGAGLGVAFLRLLDTATRLTIAGDARRAVPLHLLRLAGVAGVFVLAVLLGGAAALLGALAGFLAVKGMRLRRERARP